MPVGSTMTCKKAVWTDKAWSEAKSNLAKMGSCLYYKGEPGYDISTCGKGCEGGVEAVGCMGKYPEGLEDPKGRCFWGGTCICPKDVEWVGDLIVMIVDALNEFFQKIVDTIVCSGILDAILMTAEIGLSLIPGGAIASTAMRTGIRIAKSVAEAGSDRSPFEEWFGAQCGGKPTGIDKVWTEWIGVPDDVLPSFPGGECVKSGKKKKNCKKAPSEEDDKKKEKDAKEKWEKDHEKKQSTKKVESRPTATNRSTLKSTSASASKTSSKVSATSQTSTVSQSSSVSKAPSSSRKSAASQTTAVIKSSDSRKSTVSQSRKDPSKSNTATPKSTTTSKPAASSNASKSSASGNITQKTSLNQATRSAAQPTSSKPADEEEADEKPDIPGLVGAVTSTLNITIPTPALASTSQPVFLTSSSSQ